MLNVVVAFGDQQRWSSYRFLLSNRLYKSSWTVSLLSVPFHRQAELLIGNAKALYLCASG